MTLDEQKEALAARKAALEGLRSGPSDENPRLGQALHAVGKGQQAGLVLAFLEEYFRGRQEQLDRELFEAPIKEWASIVRTKREVEKLAGNLRALVKAGEGAGRMLQPLMELQE